MTEFQAFPKIPRLNRGMTITEKIDGTNAAVGITEDGAVYAQSRKRVITPEADNFGFARWVAFHEDELRDGLGQGLHFGEWWGLGIQRTYGQDEKLFSLFNTNRWQDGRQERPDCCGVVPVLFEGQFDVETINLVVETLAEQGSVAAPGFKPPEGVVVFQHASRSLFKVTCKDDESPKGATNES